MSEQTPSRAEGERRWDAVDDQGASEHLHIPRATLSQAEGETTDDQGRAQAQVRDEVQDQDRDEAQDQDRESGSEAAARRSEEWESGWSGP
ncbi:hypothetical protein [Streptomyces phaeoluteigriseus]